VSDPTLERHPLGVSPDDARRASADGRWDWRRIMGLALMFAGATAILVAWYGISDTVDPGEQMPYLASGGLGGAAAIAVGITLLVAREHARDRAALARVLDRLGELERRLDAMVESGTGHSDSRHERARTRG
jgi:peptidoglycan/LPS O-acetylase OafA/YrhL